MNSFVKSVSASFTVSPLVNTYLVTTASAAIVATLPDSGAPRRSKFIMIKKVDSGAGTVVITPVNSQTIDGASTLTLSNQWDSVLLVRDGSNWEVGSVSSAASVALPAMGSASGKFLTNNGSAASWSPVMTSDGTTLTVPTGKKEAVTDADGLTVGGVIVPQSFVVNFTKAVAGSLANQAFFIAHRALQVTKIQERHGTAESSAGTLTGKVQKVPSGTAVGSGTDLTSDTFNLKSAAATNQTGTLSVTTTDLQLAAGDALGFVPSAAGTEIAGIAITVTLKAI